MTGIAVPDLGAMGGAFNIETRAVAVTLNIPIYIEAVITSGYYNSGDNGGALYKRVITEPAHVGKFQSADGAWWELSESQINFEMLGAVGDGATDDLVAINNSISVAASINAVIRATRKIFAVDGIIDWSVVSQLNAEGAGSAGFPAAGDNLAATTILQLATNSITFKIGFGAHFGNFTVIYDTAQTSADTNSYAFAFYNCSRADIFNLTAFSANTSFGIPQEAVAPGIYNTLYGSTFKNLRSFYASLAHFDFRNYLGGGTDCEFKGLYANGGGSLDFVTPGTPCSYVLRGKNWSAYKIDTLEVDGQIVTQNVFDRADCHCIIDYIRCEAMTFKNNNGAILGNVSGGTIDNLWVGVIEQYNCRFLVADLDASAFILQCTSTNTNVEIDSVILDSNCNVTTPLFRLATVVNITSEDSIVNINSVYNGIGAALNGVWSTAGASVNLVRRYQGDLILNRWRVNRTTNYTTEDRGTSAPASGTYTKGSIRWNSNFTTKADALLWYCTVAGVPGTWVPLYVNDAPIP